MLKVISLSMMSFAIAACVTEEPTAETPEDTLEAPAEIGELAPALELDEGAPTGKPRAQSYCVDQSYASADNVSCDWIPSCGVQNWTSRLSRDHRVRFQWLTGCNSSTYVHVYSLWNQQCYIMRRDALRPC